MKFTSAILAILPLTLAASVKTRRQVNDSQPCQELGRGPTEAQKAAVVDYMKRTAFTDGKLCPGRDGKPDYCAVCDGAYVGVHNESLEEYCLTVEQLDEGMGKFNTEGDVCVTDFGLNVMLQLLLANVGSIYDGDLCPNKC